MSNYKKNHSVPRFMLEYWVDQNTPHKGVYVYELKSQRYYISTGQGRKPFSFAITNDLYVHTANGIRAVGLEKWFSDQENSLASIVRQVHNRQMLAECSLKDFTKIIMAIIGLECRSSYNISKIQEIIEKDSFVRKTISASPSCPPEQLVLENIVHWVNEQLPSAVPTEMVFYFAPEYLSLVLGDRPYFNHNEIEYRFVVLTNKVLLGYRHSNEFTYKYIDAEKEFIEMINKQVALNAREWLVADNPEVLKKYAALFQSDDWKQSVSSERVTWFPVQYLISGWTIDR